MSYAELETNVLLSGFEEWLRGERYADSTVYQSGINARTLVQRIVDDGELPTRLRTTARRLRKYLQGRGMAAVLGPRFDDLCERTVEKRHAPQAQKREHRSVDDDSWRELYAIVVASSCLEARVIEVMMVTGLRIGDVFRFKRSAVEQGLREGVLIFVQKGQRERTFHLHEGPLQPALERLIAAWPRSVPTILLALVDSGVYMSAYNRVDRHFKKLAGALPGRAHTHRLRRTIATQTWRETKDLRAVASMLGHASMATAQRYVDELDPDEVDKMQDRVHGRYLGGGE